jgi:hypothetical protein
MTSLAGCGSRNSLKTEYGKMRNEGSSASLNGTGVFAEMFRQSDVTVNRQGSISPRLNRYQTIVWFPDRFSAPSDEVVAALEKWINQGWGRTLIYVGRDFDCDLGYLRQVYDHTEVDDREELNRQIAEALVRRRAPQRDFVADKNRDRCDWFKTKKMYPRKIEKLSGPFADQLESIPFTLESATVLVPPKRLAEPEQQNLLKADGQPFVFRLQRPQCDGQVIVVRNGSFLLNFGLTIPAHRILASRLINACDLNGAVVFLESGPAEVRIQERADAHQPWAWISRPPLRYIVPHLLFWGVLFCFVLFPIFGRAKRFQPPREIGTKRTAASQPGYSSPSDSNSIHGRTTMTSFRAHLVALGKMLQRSEQPAAAKEKIQNYIETYGKDSTNH